MTNRYNNACLRIKSLSLAAESKIIRKEMKRYPGDSETYQGLHLHRIQDVREESRATHIARGFLKGLSYKQIEAKTYQKPNWKRVANLVTKYGTKEHRETFEAWKEA